jgi:tyrosine-protein phosphatase YwqE
MALGNIFKRLFPDKPSKLVDYSRLVVDMHSHLLPGIDDGAATIEDSIALASSLQQLGYKKLITTPHIMSDAYRNTPAIIRDKLNIVREALIKNNIDIEIDAAAEYYLDHEFIESIGKEPLLTIGNNMVLFEVSYINAPENIKEAIFRLQTEGYKPILAHPERYPFWYNSFDTYSELKDKGVLFQLNINSLSGYYSNAAKRVAEKMIDMGMIELLGTDIHHSRHLGGLQKSGNEKSFEKLLQSGNLLNASL